MAGPTHEGLSVRGVGGVLLVGFRVSPSTARTAIKGLYGDRIKIALSAPAEDGRANAQLVTELARWLCLPRDTIHIKTGHASRDKVVAFEGIGERELQNRLAPLLEGEPPVGRE